MQVAHFLEADLRPWGAALANALFAPESGSAAAAAAAAVVNSAAPCDSDSAWQCLEELRPLDGAVDAVLRAWRAPLLGKLPRTPAEWQPAVIGAEAISGSLDLSYSEAVACCDAMHAVRGVHTLSFCWSDALVDGSEAEAERACTAVASLPKLRTLEVGHDDASLFGPVAHALVSALTRLTELQELSMHWEDASLAVLARPLGLLTTLTRLDLSIDADYCQEGAVLLAPALTGLSCLAYFSLGCGGRGEVTALGPALGTLTSLTALDLSDSGVDVEAYPDAEGVDGYHAAKALALGLSHLSQLATLNLFRAYACPGGAATLAPALCQLTALTSLYMSENCIDANDAAALAPALSRLLQLAYLDLSSNELGAAGAAALAPSIALLTALTSLQLDGNGVDANGAAALAPAFSRLSRLASLDLRSNALGAAGAAALAPSIALLTKLTSLDFSSNGVGANGAAALAPALGCLTVLTFLHLSRNGIGDDGLQQLAPALARLTGLRSLSLRDDRMSDSAEDALRARLPASVWQASDLHDRPRKRQRAAAS